MVCNQIPRESKEKDVAAILNKLTTEANEESFVIVLQHGGNDVIWKWFPLENLINLKLLLSTDKKIEEKHSHAFRRRGSPEFHTTNTTKS